MNLYAVDAAEVADAAEAAGVSSCPGGTNCSRMGDLLSVPLVLKSTRTNGLGTESLSDAASSPRTCLDSACSTSFCATTSEVYPSRG